MRAGAQPRPQQRFTSSRESLVSHDYIICLRNALWKVWIRCLNFYSPPSLQFSGVPAVPEDGHCPKKWFSPCYVLTACKPAPDVSIIRSSKNGLGWNLKPHLIPNGQGHPPLDQVTHSSIQPGLGHFQGWDSS